MPVHLMRALEIALHRWAKALGKGTSKHAELKYYGEATPRLRPDLGPTEQAMPEPVVVVPYDPDWPRRFEQEGAVLRAIFARSEAAIEHVGSTAVPGLGAKPVIDVMVGLSHLADAENRIAALEAAGYEYVRKHERQLPQRRYFRKPRLGPSAYHLHCVVKGSDFWVRLLAFRDYLRAHPESATAYYELKRELAARFSREEYTVAKSPFIERTLASALGNDCQPTRQ